MKAQYILSMYLGDTKLDVHGTDDFPEEIYIAGTDHEISEMLHALNFQVFCDRFDEALHYSKVS